MPQKIVCILAHNEEKRIAVCLGSLPLDDASFRFYIVINGSTDKTAEIARSLCLGRGNTHVIEVQEPGKSRNWNHFVHTIAPDDADAYFFVDGDAQLLPGSLEAMTDALLAQGPKGPYNSVAAPPLNGSNATFYQENMRKTHGFFGDLYGLSGAFMRRIKQGGFRLPEDLIGDDGMVSSWAQLDIDRDKDWDLNRATVCWDAGFFAENLRFYDPRHIRLQYKRMLSYSLRYLQTLVVMRIMKTKGAKGLPKGINKLVSHHIGLRYVRRSPVFFLFDLMALCKIKKQYPKQRNLR